MKRSIWIVLLLLVGAAPAAAQDVVEIGRKHGAELPKWMRRELAKDPAAFEFRRAWKSDLARVKARRTRLQRVEGPRSLSGSPAQLAQRGAAVTGTYRIPVIPVLYSNTLSAPYAAAALERKLYTGPSATATLTEFYTEISRGLVTVTGDVAEWVQASQPDTVYEGADNGDEVGDLLREALEKADAVIDFKQYDSDGDGYVDFVAFVHPEAGGECGNDNVWSHRWVYEGWNGGRPYTTADGVSISDYVIQPAFNCDGSSMIDIGVFAHEYGHAFGLPDLYDTANENGGIGYWGLMGAGNWNRTASPAHMEAWSKVELGWMPVTTISSETRGLRIDPAATTGSAVRIDIPGAPGEYFLLENRQRIGSDRHLLGVGLLVWHVDSTAMATLRRTNRVNVDPTRKALEVVEADGRWDLRGDTRGDAGDPFPGSSANTAFGAATSPQSVAYNGVTSPAELRRITVSGETVTLDVVYPVPRRQWGDVTGDGYVRTDDVLAVLERSIGKPTSRDLSLGDVDGDGDVDGADALVIQSYVAGVDVSGYRVGRDAP